jgi:hypothetical protein
MGSSKPSSLFDRAAKNLALAAGTFLVLFIAAELTARVFYHPENLGTIIRFDRLVGWSLRPNASCRSVDFERDLDYTVEINSLGMRDREITLQKPPGKRRILLIGDSVTFGTGVDAGWRFSDFMQRALGDRVEVINAGVPGWGTDQELIYFENSACRLEPDVVVLVFTTANDVVNNGLDHLFLGSAPKPRFDVAGDTLILADEVPKPAFRQRRPVWKSVLRQSRFLLFVKRRIDRWSYNRMAYRAGKTHVVDEVVAPHPVPRGFGKDSCEGLTHWSVFECPPTPETTTAWRVTEAILARFARCCRELNAELILFALPPRLEVDTRWRAKLMEQTGVEPECFDFSQPFERLTACCRRYGIEFVHPLSTYTKACAERELYHHKDSHPNRYGHALAARVLLERLRETRNWTFELANDDLRYFNLQ